MWCIRAFLLHADRSHRTAVVIWSENERWMRGITRETGVCFERQSDGAVKILNTEGRADDVVDHGRRGADPDAAVTPLSLAIAFWLAASLPAFSAWPVRIYPPSMLTPQADWTTWLLYR